MPSTNGFGQAACATLCSPALAGAAELARLRAEGLGHCFQETCQETCQQASASAAIDSTERCGPHCAEGLALLHCPKEQGWATESSSQPWQASGDQRLGPGYSFPPFQHLLKLTSNAYRKSGGYSMPQSRGTPASARVKLSQPRGKKSPETVPSKP